MSTFKFDLTYVSSLFKTTELRLGLFTVVIYQNTAEVFMVNHNGGRVLNRELHRSSAHWVSRWTSNSVFKFFPLCRGSGWDVGHNSNCTVIRKEIQQGRECVSARVYIPAFALFCACALLLRLPCAFLQMRLTNMGQAVLFHEEAWKAFAVRKVICS